MLAQSDDMRAVYPSLRNKRVLITGGGSGIGAGIVEAFARQGSDVTFIDVQDGDSEELAESSGARFKRVDLVDIGKTARCIEALVDEGGPIDVLVNNAANDDRHKIDDVTEHYWDDRLNVNLKHQFFCAQVGRSGNAEKWRRRDRQSRLHQLAPRPPRTGPLPDLQSGDRRDDPSARSRSRPATISESTASFPAT